MAAACLLGAAPALAGDWQVIAPSAEGFAAEFPAEPAYRDVVELQSPAVEFFHDYRLARDENVFFVDVIKLTPVMRDVLTDLEVVEFAAGVAGPDCERGTLREIAMAGGVGYETTFRCPNDVTMRLRLRIEGPWVYQVAAAGGPGFVATPEVARFLDSFRLADS